MYSLPTAPTAFGIQDGGEALLVRTWLQFHPGTRLQDTDGNTILIVVPGRRNHYDGPDILEATIYYRGQVLTGPVECHVAADAWFQHGHHRNRAYDTVILHVVQTPLPVDIPDLPHVIIPPYTFKKAPSTLPQTLPEIFAAGHRRWQDSVAAARRLSGNKIPDWIIRRSIPLFATKGNAAGFQQILDHSDLPSLFQNSDEDPAIHLSHIAGELNLTWHSAGIRPAARAPLRLERWARFIARVVQEQPDQTDASALRHWVCATLPSDLATEVSGNILLPLMAALALNEGKLASYRRVYDSWQALKLSQPYARVLRNFSPPISRQDLCRFPILQGCLALLTTHA